MQHAPGPSAAKVGVAADHYALYNLERYRGSLAGSIHVNGSREGLVSQNKPLASNSGIDSTKWREDNTEIVNLVALGLAE